MRSFAALVCGYGVPKDIFTDLNYNAYLRPCFNWLYNHYRDSPGLIALNGGATDCYRPYRRTEAGEMARWWRRAIHDLGVSWQVSARPKSLSSAENLLNFLPLASSATDAIVFCEATRAPRLRRLKRELPDLVRAKIIPIDFDGSPRRYTPIRTRKSERDFLRLELAALKNKKNLVRLRQFMEKKLTLMRRYSPEEAHRRLPEILERLHREEA